MIDLLAKVRGSMLIVLACATLVAVQSGVFADEESEEGEPFTVEGEGLCYVGYKACAGSCCPGEGKCSNQFCEVNCGKTTPYYDKSKNKCEDCKAGTGSCEGKNYTRYCACTDKKVEG